MHITCTCALCENVVVDLLIGIFVLSVLFRLHLKKAVLGESILALGKYIMLMETVCTLERGCICWAVITRIAFSPQLPAVTMGWKPSDTIAVGEVP